MTEIRGVLLAAMTMILGFMVIVFIYQTFKKNRKNHVLTMAFIMGLTPIAAMTLNELFPSGSSEDAIMHLVGGFGFSFMFFLVYLHYELVYRTSPHYFRFLVMSTLLGIRFAVVTYKALIYPLDLLIHASYYASFDVMRLFAFSFGAIITWKTWKMTKERESFVELCSLFLLIGGGLLGIVHRPANIGIINSEFLVLNVIRISSFLSMSYLLTVLGMVLFLSVFIVNPDYLYRLPVPLYHIIVYNGETGLAPYSHAIRSKGIEGPEITDQLFSGAITAITSLLSESVKDQVRLRLILSDEQTVIFEHHDQLPVSALLVCHQLTYFVKKSLKNFIKSILLPTLKELSDPNPSDITGLKNELNQLLQASFPYIEFSD